MSSDRRKGPSWLFSFVDLAFLLLIAMTQLGGPLAPDSLELGEIQIPLIDTSAALRLPADARERWQVRVHPPIDSPSHPFELARESEPGRKSSTARLDGPGLKSRLADLRAARAGKPLIAPHENSHSRDLLGAVGYLEEFWPSNPRATIAPVSARR
jgi:hypothetical protein